MLGTGGMKGGFGGIGFGQKFGLSGGAQGNSGLS